jgi:hypothetical protein
MSAERRLRFCCAAAIKGPKSRTSKGVEIGADVEMPKTTRFDAAGYLATGRVMFPILRLCSSPMMRISRVTRLAVSRVSAPWVR